MPDVFRLEQDFMVKIAGSSVRGKIDRVDRLPDGTVELIDYKTGAPKDPAKLEADAKRQLLLYQLAAERALALKPSKLTFYYLEDGTQASFLGKEDDLAKLELYVSETVDRIKEGEFLPTPGWQCGFCDFAGICEFRQK
jgi:RecB family exonuclease